MTPKHVFFAILVATIWGVNFLITKVGLDELPPVFFTFLRYTTVAFPLVFFVRRGGIPWSVIFQVGFFLGILTFTLAFVGIKLGAPAGLTSLVLQVQVVFTLCLSALVLNDRPKPEQWIGVLISGTGILLLFWNFSGSPTVAGLAFVVAGGLANAVNNIVLRKSGGVDMFRLMIWMSIVPPLPLLAVSLAFESGQWEALMNVTHRGVGAVMFNAFISTVVGFGLFGFLLKTYSPNQVTPFAFLTPVVGLIGGYLFLDESLNSTSVIACVFVMLGLVFPRFIYPMFAKTNS